MPASSGHGRAGEGALTSVAGSRSRATLMSAWACGFVSPIVASDTACSGYVCARTRITELCDESFTVVRARELQQMAFESVSYGAGRVAEAPSGIVRLTKIDQTYGSIDPYADKHGMLSSLARNVGYRRGRPRS